MNPHCGTIDYVSILETEFYANDRALMNGEIHDEGYRVTKRRRASMPSGGTILKGTPRDKSDVVRRRVSDPCYYTAPQVPTEATNQHPKIPQGGEDRDIIDKIVPFGSLSEERPNQENFLSDDSMEPIPLSKFDDRQCSVVESSRSISKACSASIVTVDEEVCLGKDFKPGPWDVVSSKLLYS